MALPYSHVTEVLLRSCASLDFENAENVLRKRFPDVTKIAPSEIIAVLLVLTDEMKQVFEHTHFEAVKEGHKLALAVASRILGSRENLTAGYLSGVISGPIDADKIDYMARDSYHSGFPIGLDFNRLISKLEVIIITPDNAPNPELAERARGVEGRSYEMGISLSGLGAYEQMIIGRALLYDRLYYHHKVRAAEHMLRTLIEVVSEESERTLGLADYFKLFSESEYLSVWSGSLESKAISSGKARAARLGGAISMRRVHNRAMCIASRFLAGLDGLPEEDRRQTRQIQWDALVSALSTDAGAKDFAGTIFTFAQNLSSNIPDLSRMGDGLSREDVLVDFPTNKASVGRGNDFLTRTEAGQVVPPNLFFNPEMWSQAYEHQKLIGHIFAPMDRVPLVALAGKIALFTRFGVIMGPEADNAAKITGVVKAEWIRDAAGCGLCSDECLEALITEKPNLLHIRADQLTLPEGWSSEDPGLAKRLAQEFKASLPGGLPASSYKAVVDSIFELLSFVDMLENTGTFVKFENLLERTLQAELKKHLCSRGVPVQEGLEVCGGETDLILYNKAVVENKVADEIDDPFAQGGNYAYQARRYSMAILQKVSFIVFAYKPKTEAAIRPLTQRIRVSRVEGILDEHVQVRIVVPWGADVPSTAKAPPVRKNK